MDRSTMARISGLACGAVLALCLLGPVEGRAATGPIGVVLDYTAVAGCPEADEVKAIVTRQLGYDPFREDAAEHVLVQIAARPPAFEGHIEWRDTDGKWVGDRTFPSRSNDCRALARAMAFALALQVQLSANAAAPPAEPPPAEPTSQPEAPLVAPPPPVAAPRPSSAAREPVIVSAPAPSPAEGHSAVLHVGGGAAFGFGVASGLVPFGRVFAGMAWSRWSLELGGEAGWPTTERRGDGAGFSQQELLLGLAGCRGVGRWSGCLLVKGGGIRIAGKDIDAPVTSWAPLLETGLRLAVTQPLGGRTYVVARAEGLLLVTRWRVALDRTTVWTSSRFTEALGLDVGVRFP